jgi:hypothetical protein
MIDGFKTSYLLPNFPDWKEKTGIRFNATVNEDTGEVKEIVRNNKKTGLSYTSIEHRATFETYQLTVNEITHTGKKTKFILNITGSLHKNHFGGKNHSRFTFADLCSQIEYLCRNLHLNANKCILKTLEYGFNLPVNFAPFEYLNNNIISFKLKEFQKFETDSLKSIGFNCRLNEYWIKLYDKGLQHDLNVPLLRFEKAYKKLTTPKKFGISTLDDLTKSDTIKRLQNELLEAWDDVFLFDETALINLSISQKEKIELLEYRDPRYLLKIKNRNSRKLKKDRCKGLLLKYGSNGKVHSEIKELLIKEFKKCTVLPSVEKRAEKPKEYGLTIKINSKTVPIEKRYCKGCGNPLHPDQKKGSVFCSAKFVGYERAHQCRNIVFNPSNNFTKKLMNIEAKGLLFDIQPFFDPGKRKFL